ncbi:unnamed protein product [Lactuca virosa]|uniref:DNA mismatch repair proteins mutS family domain-containing protein n=1 Tax=Lactuca virosa TaxID=75947 RepID=A0AAU9LVN4_9ASTR|nr:unnamed protein product [Lactuca virosa]
MSELCSIITGATSNSLVLVAEICRGIETTKGTCIVGSFVETLDSIGCLGIVSTHLHDIFKLPLNTNNTVFKAMGSEFVNGQTKPTWKLTNGICRESLAFETAQREGVPKTIIQRAQELYASDLEKAVSLICKKSKSEGLIRCVGISLRKQLPPSVIGASSVYVIIRPDNRLYVGEVSVSFFSHS